MTDSMGTQSSPLIRRAPAESESMTAAIINAIEKVADSRPDTPLYEIIDPDALEALFNHGTQRVHFEYDGYAVTIQPDRTILVSDPNA